jgi:flagellar basal body-associated protein FliL
VRFRNLFIAIIMALSLALLPGCTLIAMGIASAASSNDESGAAAAEQNAKQTETDALDRDTLRRSGSN